MVWGWVVVCTLDILHLLVIKIVLMTHKPSSLCALVSPWEVCHLYLYDILHHFLTMTSSRGLQRTSYQWWPILLGRNALASTKRSLSILGHWLVQPFGTSRCHYGYQVRSYLSTQVVPTDFWLSQLCLCKLHLDRKYPRDRLCPYPRKDHWYLCCCTLHPRYVPRTAAFRFMSDYPFARHDQYLRCPSPEISQ